MDCQTSAPVYITLHARQRAKERLSLSLQSLNKLAERAWYLGISLRQSKGRLRRYLQELWDLQNKADNIRLYGEYVFLFSDTSLLTVWHLPPEFRKYVRVLKSVSNSGQY